MGIARGRGDAGTGGPAVGARAYLRGLVAEHKTVADFGPAVDDTTFRVVVVAEACIAGHPVGLQNRAAIGAVASVVIVLTGVPVDNRVIGRILCSGAKQSVMR